MPPLAQLYGESKFAPIGSQMRELGPMKSRILKLISKIEITSKMTYFLFVTFTKVVEKCILFQMALVPNAMDLYSPSYG